MKQYRNQMLTCQDCRQEFVFSIGEQEWFDQKGFPPPIRCKECRALRKRQGVWGTRAMQVDVLTRQVLCSKCGKPASRNFSLHRRKAVCPECGGGNEPTRYPDAMTIEEWVEIAGDIVRGERDN